MKYKEHYDVIVIGGGPSGMMAAGVASDRGKRVLLLEKNPKLGEKLKITGGGRCNITNKEHDNHAFLKHFGQEGKFLYSAFSQFDVKNTFSFFEKRKLPLVTESRNRVFPKSQKAYDVFKVMEKYIKHKNVTVMTDSPVIKIKTKRNEALVSGVYVGDTLYTSDSFVLATGGKSHPETGSTGDGFAWLRKLGHKVALSHPDIVPISVKERWIKRISGVTLSFMKITFYVEGKKAFSKKGKILFTHFGLSGPLILNSSHKIADLLHAGKVTAEIDAFPDTDIGALRKRILKIFDTNKNKTYKNIVEEIAPFGMGDTLVTFRIIQDTATKVHSISKQQRYDIASLMKAFPLTVTGLMGMDRAVASGGGVVMEEVDTKTMRSRLYKNLYLTGDILHINRPSGGYSLQLCWTTGHVAGMHC